MSNVTTVCGHPDRYRTMDGRWLCETCARTADGWKACRHNFPRCPNLTPPDRRFCEQHAPADEPAACPECAGEGAVDCDEYDCHGRYCEEGELQCPTCGGAGEILPVAATP